MLELPAPRIGRHLRHPRGRPHVPGGPNFLARRVVRHGRHRNLALCKCRGHSCPRQVTMEECKKGVGLSRLQWTAVDMDFETGRFKSHQRKIMEKQFEGIL